MLLNATPVLTHRISVGAASNGTVTHGGAGGDALLSTGTAWCSGVAPASGYRVANVLVDGQSLIAAVPVPPDPNLAPHTDGSYACTFSGVTADHSLTATFAEVNPVTSQVTSGLPFEGNLQSSSPAVSGNGQRGLHLLGNEPSSPEIPMASTTCSCATVLGSIKRVSVASDGSQATGRSTASTQLGCSLSANGRYIAFDSYATNLVTGDTNSAADIFVHDGNTEATERVSVASDATQANGLSADPSISADGRYVAFISSASNLVAGDTNGTNDIFMHDRQTGSTVRVSVAGDGTEANGASANPAIDADGRFVALSPRLPRTSCPATRWSLRRVRSRSPDGLRAP